MAKPQRKTLAGIVGSVTAAAALFVMIPREESGRVVKATVQQDGSIAIQHVSGRLYLKPYLDIVQVPTACDGITKGVKLGQVYTEARCNELLEEELIAHAAPIIACVPALRGRPDQVVAAVDLAYNIGPAGVCRSSIARLWNAGRWREGCERFPLFNKAGGKVRAGLVARRARDRAICLRGLPS